MKGGGTLKDRIKQLRNSLELTQQKFADRLGLKRQTIAAYEIGNIEPSDSTLLLICKEFNVNEEWLRTGNGEPYKKRTRNQELQAFANDVMDDVDESFKKKFILALSKLDESDWEILKKIADELSKED